MNQNCIKFIEVGCWRQAGRLVEPYIESGLQGIFLDANQKILLERKKSLLANPKSNKSHLFICSLVGVSNTIQPFYMTNLGYSSCDANHVITHIKSHQNNLSVSQEERDVKLNDIEHFWMPTLTLNNLLFLSNETRLELLNVDCEGLDCLMIAATDFSVFKPKVICFETGHSEGTGITNGRNYYRAEQHLKSFGYQIVHHDVTDTIAVLKS